jgi:hypothetical protein
LIPKAKKSGLWTRIAATETVSLCLPTKSWRRLWNRNLPFALFLFNGDFGRLNNRKNLTALFEVHSLD